MYVCWAKTRRVYLLCCTVCGNLLLVLAAVLVLQLLVEVLQKRTFLWIANKTIQYIRGPREEHLKSFI